MRNITFENGSFYHVFNRGVDKRDITLDIFDSQRFYDSLNLFNGIEPIGHMANYSQEERSTFLSCNELVDILGYCLNPNHFHLLLRQKVDAGISTFMHRLGSGYTRYFNEKHERTGSLFQGQFKAAYIGEGDHLDYLLTYVNRNDEVHGYSQRNRVTLIRRGWKEYVNNLDGLCCDKVSILSKYSSLDSFKKTSDRILVDILRNKNTKRDREGLF